MARLPCTISLMRRGGTPMSFASRYSVRPSGLRNSSTSISPGVTSGSSLVFSFTAEHAGGQVGLLSQVPKKSEVLRQAANELRGRNPRYLLIAGSLDKFG